MSTEATGTITEPSMSLKLLIDTKANSVLFAEAGKDFVDFLFSLMSLPIGTVTRLLSADEMVGSLGKVYRSLETLSDAYRQPQADKSAMLLPKAAVSDSAAKLLSLPSTGFYPPIYKCGHCSAQTVTLDPNDSCDGCRNKMSRSVSVKAASSPAGGGGYVKDSVIYMIMDDLEVKPMSTISTIALINKFGIREIGDLQELVVSFGMDEGLKLLKSSLKSKTVLTAVFLGSGSNTVTEIPV